MFSVLPAPDSPLFFFGGGGGGGRDGERGGEKVRGREREEGGREGKRGRERDK